MWLAHYHTHSILSPFLSAKHSLVTGYRNMASDQPREDHDAYPYPNNSVVSLPNTHSPPFRKLPN